MPSQIQAMMIAAATGFLATLGGAQPLADEMALIQREVQLRLDECLQTRGLRRVEGLAAHGRSKDCGSSVETSGSALECNTAYVPLAEGGAFRCVWDYASRSCKSQKRRLCDESVPGFSFAETWDQQEDRLWLGRDWFANNAQDWRIAGGRVECINSDPAVAGRTAHLLTQTVPQEQQHFSLEVTIGMVEPGPLVERAFAGVLVKMGGANIDYRQTALVQMVPGHGGGLLIGLNAEGCLCVRRFTSQGFRTPSLWVASHPSGRGYDFSALETVVEDTRRLPLAAWPLRLTVSYKKGRPLLVQALGADGSLASVQAKLFNDFMTGGISLFSAYGPAGSSHGFSFDDLRLAGTQAKPERAFGPVLGVLYTVATYGDGRLGLEGADKTELRLTAQHPVLGPGHSLRLQLSVDGVDGRRPLDGTFHSDDGSWNTRFVVPYEGQANHESTYRLMLDGQVVYSGVIRREKTSKEEVLIGSLSCTKNAYGKIRWDSEGMWFPFNDVTSSLEKHDPDLLFFAGDQVYDGDITPADLRSEYHTLLDYHTKWQRFLWSFGGLTKDRPTVSIPDDHDMFQGNLFGSGGKTNTGHLSSLMGHYHIGAGNQTADRSSEKGDGYCLSGSFVNAVSATQVSHLPPSRLTPQIGNEGARTYATSFRFGGLDLIVLQDRTWKSGPDTSDPDPPLLGEEQEVFLQAWADARSNGSWAKVAFSESPFSSLTTQWTNEGTVDKDHSHIVRFGEYPGQHAQQEQWTEGGKDGADVAGEDAQDGVPEEAHEDESFLEVRSSRRTELGDEMNKDAKDTNGWPPLARTRAVRLLARAGALHLTGDQHLGVVAQYGVDAYNDGSTVFSSPAVASAFPRRWMPAAYGENRWEGAERYMGGYTDAMGNKFTMLAVSNPARNDPSRRGVPEALAIRSPGYGIARFHPAGLRKHAAKIVLENWPNWADPENRSQMYDDWPVVLNARARPTRIGRTRAIPPRANT